MPAAIRAAGADGDRGAAVARLGLRARQLVVSLIVACAMVSQNLDCTIIANAQPAGD